MKRLFGCLAIAVLSACASSSTPVRVRGDPVTIAWLAGSWDGEYWGGSGGRRGSLSLHLESGTDSLYGDVLMTDPRGNVVQSADPTVVHQQHVQSSQRLRIQFVAAHSDSVRGVLEPYVSPDCQCTVSTAFVGKVQGNEVTGTFATRRASEVWAQGFWRMTRTGSTPPSAR